MNINRRVRYAIGAVGVLALGTIAMVASLNAGWPVVGTIGVGVLVWTTAWGLDG